MNIKKDEKKEKDGEGTGEEEKGKTYGLEMSLWGFVLPIGLIVGGLVLYFGMLHPRVRFLGLFLILVGLFATLAIAIPLIRLHGAQVSLEEQEREIRFERLKEEGEDSEP